MAGLRGTELPCLLPEYRQKNTPQPPQALLRPPLIHFQIKPDHSIFRFGSSHSDHKGCDMLSHI